MAGVIDAQAMMGKRPTLSYTRGAITRMCLIAPRPQSMHGHEFHYSTLEGLPDDTSMAYALEAGTGISGDRDGIVQDAVLASYGHLYFGDARARDLVDGVRAAARR